MATRQLKKTRRHKRRTHHSKKRNSVRHSRRRRLIGGNYQEATTRTLEGVPTKDANKFVVTVSGYGTMSGAAYLRLMEQLDRNGADIYD